MNKEIRCSRLNIYVKLVFQNNDQALFHHPDKKVDCHPPPIRDLYCAIAGQVSAAPSHVSLARPDPSAIWSCSIPHRKAQTAAMFSCRAAWQRCGPLARRAAYRLPLDGESSVYPEKCAWLVCVYTICLAVTYGRVHSVPRSVSACITYSKSESLHVWRSDERFWRVKHLNNPRYTYSYFLKFLDLSVIIHIKSKIE